MEKLFVRVATQTAKVAGKPWTFIACVAIVLVWGLSGPLLGFSEKWQLLINSFTTIVTFLMVFLIQNTQNRDGAAMQAKLDELIYAQRGADSRFIGIEHLTESELAGILEEVEKRALAVHEGKPASAIKGKPGKRADDIEAEQPKAATPAKARARAKAAA